MQAASVGFQCPECVAEGARGIRQIRLADNTPYLTYSVIGANLMVAFVLLSHGSGWFDGSLGRIGIDFGLVGAGLTTKGGQLVVVGVDAGEPYRIFTSAFLHAGPIHLAFNMILMWQFGALLEPALGRLRFSLLFLVSLIGGSFGALLVTPDTITVGASGAVFGLMGATFLAQRSRGMNPMRSGVGFLIAINLVLTFVIPGISIGGHIGGLAAGGAVAWMLYESPHHGVPRWGPVWGSAGLGAVLFIGALWAATRWADPIL
ncbi:MAG TPA: rhomboid family intramembrane serine protease [Dehalococcoidia bacterium]|nr:rhomboid family intramembrane serine protease [Dehalococcoidia bacterium]